MLNLTKFKDRRYFDEKKIPPDVWDVLKTASVLSVGEFRVFEIAYEQWFGEKGDEKTIENFFMPYMFKSIVPIWVRQFCERILKLDHQGALNPVEFGVVGDPPATRDQKWQGVEAFTWVIGITMALIFVSHLTAQMTKVTCGFPPC